MQDQAYVSSHVLLQQLILLHGQPALKWNPNYKLWHIQFYMYSS